MRLTLQIILGTVVLMFLNAAPSYASAVTINPKAIGEPEKPFSTTSIGLNYASALSQTMTGAFSETEAEHLTTFTFRTVRPSSIKPDSIKTIVYRPFLRHQERRYRPSKGSRRRLITSIFKSMPIACSSDNLRAWSVGLPTSFLTHSFTLRATLTWL